MARRLDVSDALVIKLASLAVHADEFMEETNPVAADADLAAIRALLVDPEVREFLDAPRMISLLPVKRKNRAVLKFVPETDFIPGAPVRPRKIRRKK